MKYMRHTSSLALLLALLLLTVTACGGLPEIKQENGLYTDTATGKTYRAAHPNYSPISLTDRELARINHESVDDLIFYAIRGMEESGYMAATSGMILVPSDRQLPSLWELPVTELHVYETGSGSGANLANIKDQTLIAALAAAYRSELSFLHREILPTLQTATYELSFLCGGDYSGLSYSLYYIHAKEEVLIYDVIEDAENFDIRFPGVEVTTEVYEYEETENGVTVQKSQLMAVYHFGHHLLLDRTTGECRPIDATLSALLPQKWGTA